MIFRLLPRDLRESIQGDLAEEYPSIVARRGRVGAAVWFWWSVLRLVVAFRWERAAHGRPLPPIADEAPRRFTAVESMTQDLLFAARLLRRQPAFTFVAVLMLALGTGATTAIFGVVDAVLWRPLPFAGSDRIVSIGEQRPREGRVHGPVAPADFYDWRRDSQSFTAIAAIDPGALNLSGSGEPERLRAIVTTTAFLDVLGISPRLGRNFRVDEETRGKNRVVLLADRLWRRRFGADPTVVGQSITLNSVPYLVVGVLPSTFWWPLECCPAGAEADLIVPYADDSAGATRSLHSLTVIARLKANVSLEQARAEMDAIGRRLSQLYPQENINHGPHTMPLQDWWVGDVRHALLLLATAVALLLTIACANLATLLLAKATGRQREIGVRIALGAGRARLVRQMLTESLLLTIVGGATGMLVAMWSIGAFRAMLPAHFLGLPGMARIAIDGRVLAIAVMVSAVTGLVFGVVPAFTASDQHTSATLREHGRGEDTIRGGRARSALIVIEVALSVMLLVGAGLLMVSFKRLLDVAPGFQPENVLAAPVVLPESRYDRARAVLFYQSLLERVRGLPQVESTGAISALPFSGSDARASFQIEGRTTQSALPVRAHPRLITPGYLTTLGIPLLRGRLFTDRDADGAADVVIINASAARRYWPGEDPIGKRISFAFGVARWLEIVGIVGDIKHASLDVDAEPEAYLSYRQSNFETMTRFMTIVVRTRSDAAMMAPLLRAVVNELDADQAIGAVAQMQTLIDRTIAPRRLNLWLVSGFAFVALVLTGAGLYGVMAYLVAQRTHEIGVRVALGATSARVLALVLHQAGTMTALGLAIGVAAALAASRFLAGLLFGVSATDPVVYLAVGLVLAAVALLSIAVPLLRATRIDPLIALRE